MATACLHKEIRRNTGDLRRRVRAQPEAREGQAGPGGVAEGPVVPSKSGNADGGKGPWLKAAPIMLRLITGFGPKRGAM